MKVTDLYKLIAEREGKKSEVSIGNIREIVGIIADLLTNDEVYKCLVKLGKRRAKRK